MSFQTVVNPTPAPGIAGDFASTNPRHNAIAGPGGLVCGPLGVICGRFAWVDLATGSIVTNSGAGAPTGFVKNNHMALVTTYLGETSLTVPPGYMMADLFNRGDFWALNETGAAVTPGLKVYVNNTNGKISSFAATGSPVNSGTSTASTIAAGTSSVTGSIAIPVAGATVGPGMVPAILTVTVVGSGTVYPGTIISGTGVVTGTQIVAQLSGTTGGVGTYSVSIPQTVASTTISGTYGLLTVGGTVGGTYAVGQTVTGSTTAAGTVITALGTGTGGAGTYIVNLTQTVGSGALDTTIGTETIWYAASYGSGATGEVIKITTVWP